METIDPSHYPASRAAGVAANCINYKLGGPFRYFKLDKVKKASKESIPGVGNKYHLEFSMEDDLNKQPSINCTAEVLYYKNEAQTPPKVTYKLQPEPQNYTAAKDQEFYTKMKSRSEPLVAENIPDDFGNIPTDLEPIRYLGLAACSFVKWQNSTEETLYSMSVIKSIKQLPRDDAVLEFHFCMLIHQMISQEMEPWLIITEWCPQGGTAVKKYQRLPKIKPDESSSRQR